MVHHSGSTENLLGCSEKITLNAPAKLNLYLEVLGKRSDGYHNLCSLFQMVGLYDSLSMTEVAVSKGLALKVEGVSGEISLAADASNLVLRAANLLQKEMQEAGFPARGARIHLMKKIPISAGMGGGSSDAAATLIGLNRLWSLGWSCEKLAELGGQIGSDLPFFFYGPTAWVSGRGEVVEPVSQVLEGIFLLVHPPFAVSTAAVFKAYEQARTQERENGNIELTNAATHLSIPLDVGLKPLAEEILRHPHNDLEKVTLSAHPVLKEIKVLLKSLGSECVLMSGSGPSLFAYFEDSDAANVAALQMEKHGHRVSVVPTLKQSPFKDFL